MNDKKMLTEALISSFKKSMFNALENKRCEKAMAAISSGCQALYMYNQVYMDSDFENGVLEIAKILSVNYRTELNRYHSQEKVILFYDGFGLDTRGVAKMYINALAKNGYKIIYVTCKKAQGRIPATEKLLEQAHADVYFIETRATYSIWVKQLMGVIFECHPKAMFFYTTPNDSAGAVSFSIMEGMVDRFLIDLTDHAFWRGTKCNDYFCGSRGMSASNQVYERNIPREKLIKLGVNLVIDDEDDEHLNLPFDVTSTRYIFSGGQLYKTLGDRELLYYRIVKHILSNHLDVFFLYAGEGNHEEMDKILAEYPDRAHLIPERKDFYYLIKNCVFYLNTYPMFGGMMMKYAANAGKIPITLKHDNDSDGLLIDQESRKIEYKTFEELISDVDRLLENEKYLSEREELLKGSVISEERFIKNVRMTIEEHHTDYEHGTERIDTTQFKKEFFERLDIDEVKNQVSKRINRSLFLNYPWMALNLIKRKLIKNTYK